MTENIQNTELKKAMRFIQSLLWIVPVLIFCVDYFVDKSIDNFEFVIILWCMAVISTRSEKKYELNISKKAKKIILTILIISIIIGLIVGFLVH